jgi:hypothetical protein
MGDPSSPANVLSQFDLGGEVAGIQPAAEGHINLSWIVTVRGSAGTPGRFLLQRINESVFREPERVMENIALVTRHLAEAVRRSGAADAERRALRLVPTRGHASYHRDPGGGVWRLYPFIGGTLVREHVDSREEAREIGRAFGTFQRLMADYSGPRLHETIPRFHDTAWRVETLERAIAIDRAGRARSAHAEIEAVRARSELAEVLPALLESGEIVERVAHNDAKSSNVLLDERTGAALCVVDLDTVMHGTLLYDFGDMVRSATSPTAEDERDLRKVGVRVPLFAGLVEGYVSALGPVLAAAERDLLVFAGKLITFEQAVRFLADHLDGDRYYRTTCPEHNLVRCRTQLKLIESLEHHEDALRRAVERATPK